MSAVMPFLTYDDPAKAIDWLEQAFGFTRANVSVGPDGQVNHAELRAKSGFVLMTPASGGTLPMRSPRELPFTNQGTYIQLDSPEEVAEHYERAIAAGATVVLDLEDKPWGSREYTCQDLEGHVWSFGTYAPG